MHSATPGEGLQEDIIKLNFHPLEVDMCNSKMKNPTTEHSDMVQLCAIFPPNTSRQEKYHTRAENGFSQQQQPEDLVKVC